MHLCNYQLDPLALFLFDSSFFFSAISCNNFLLILSSSSDIYSACVFFLKPVPDWLKAVGVLVFDRAESYP